MEIKEDIMNELRKVCVSFEEAHMNCECEFFLDEDAKCWFNVKNITKPVEVVCKTIEYASASISSLSSMLWDNHQALEDCDWDMRSELREEATNLNISLDYFVDALNNYCGKDWEVDDICNILYPALGNGVDRDLTIRFIESNYDLDILENQIK